MIRAPQERAELQAAMVHLDAVKLRAAAEALFDAIGLDKALAEIEMARRHIVERAVRRGKGDGWVR